MGFEPTRTNTEDLKTSPLDHSGTAAFSSRAGNRTLVLSVTAIDTNHYTTREWVGTPGAKCTSPNPNRRPRAPRSRQRADIIRGVDRCRTPPIRMSHSPRTSAYAEERWRFAMRWPDGAAVDGRRIEPRPGHVSDSQTEFTA